METIHSKFALIFAILMMTMTEMGGVVALMDNAASTPSSVPSKAVRGNELRDVGGSESQLIAWVARC